MARVMDIRTPLGDALLFHSMSASEALGRLAEYQIGVVSEKNDLDPDKLLGKNVTVRLEIPDADPRFFDAYVIRFALSGMRGRYHYYQIVARPWLWFLTRASDCRIFQDKKAPEIIQQIFEKYSNASFEMRLSGSYRTRTYCVQYRETDFNFVSRLMEQEGIYHYMKHAEGKHTVVLTDSYSGHAPYPGYEQIPFMASGRAVRPEQEHITDWVFSREIQTGAYVIDDYDFEKPSVELQT
ncbi:MAG TPA: type VI secretion system tip protein TssI/VgrG, partial [Burkholderiales bacterium]